MICIIHMLTTNFTCRSVVVSAVCYSLEIEYENEYESMTSNGM